MAAMLGGEQVDIAFDELREIDLLTLEVEAPPRLDPRQIEQLGHDAAEPLGLAVDMAKKSRRALGRERSLDQQLAESLQGRERRPQLMRDDRQEFRLGLVELTQAYRRGSDLVLQLAGEAALAEREPDVLDAERQVSRDFLGGRADTGRKLAQALHREHPEGSRSRVERQREPAHGPGRETPGPTQPGIGREVTHLQA